MINEFFYLCYNKKIFTPEDLKWIQGPHDVNRPSTVNKHLHRIGKKHYNKKAKDLRIKPFLFIESKNVDSIPERIERYEELGLFKDRHLISMDICFHCHSDKSLVPIELYINYVYPFRPDYSLYYITKWCNDPLWQKIGCHSISQQFNEIKNNLPSNEKICKVRITFNKIIQEL